jgi:predicted nucleic acid-binding protein
MYLLDTDILIDIQRGHSPAIELLTSLEEIPRVPGFVIMELIQGTRNKEQVRKVLQLVAPLPTICPSETDCNRALDDFTAYHLSHNLGLIDALIAACAIGHGLVLCTFNNKHYRVIPNLNMQQPYNR